MMVSSEVDLIKVARPQAISRLRAAAEQMEPGIRRAFEQALDDLRGRVGEAELARLVEARDINGLMRLFRSELLEDALQPVSTAVAAAVMEGGSVAAAIQPTVTGLNGQQVTFVFNATNPRLTRFASAQAALRVREISNDIQAVARSTITDGLSRGLNPRDTARLIRQSIGLTAKQQASVNNFRRMLETRDIDALSRALRDRRFDATIRRAFESGQPLSRAQIDRMVERYRERFIKFRSEVIAKTESIKSVQAAQHELIQSYVDDGRIAAEQVRRFWHYTRDERTRAGHRQIPAMNPNGVAQDEPFQTPLGPLMYPGDPSGRPANIIQCRCTAFTRVVSAELLEDA